jgi:hypothetical protein
MSGQDKKTYIEEETFIVRHSGEIPEVIYHGSLYYLTEDPTGPGIELALEDTKPLSQAVVERYREIVLRDLEPANRDKGLYRGLARCVVYWQRLEKFCRKEELEFSSVRSEVATALQQFLFQELEDVAGGLRVSCVKCNKEDIESLAVKVGLNVDDLPEGWGVVCQNVD